MQNGWTGGQYSLLRVGLGLWIAAGAGWVGVLLSLPFLLGYRDRYFAAGLLIYGFVTDAWADLWAPLLLALHLAVPPAPYGSLDAWGRVDPAGDFELPPWIAPVALGAAALLFAFEQGERSERAVALVAAATAAGGCFKPATVWPWFALASAAAVVLGVTGPGVLLVVALTWAPARLGPAGRGGADRVYYDGSCGLCHRAVRFAVAEERGRDLFRFAPLDGETFLEEVPLERRAKLPDSLIVQSGTELLSRSGAVLALGRRLGGYWRVGATVVGLLPAALLDPAYDAVARIRDRLFAAPAESCPTIPQRLRRRFDP